MKYDTEFDWDTKFQLQKGTRCLLMVNDYKNSGFSVRCIKNN
jgi:hypothetical protein